MRSEQNQATINIAIEAFETGLETAENILKIGMELNVITRAAASVAYKIKLQAKLKEAGLA